MSNAAKSEDNAALTQRRGAAHVGEQDRDVHLGTPWGGVHHNIDLHRLGFLRDGLNPAAAKTRPAGPPNGLLQTLHRGAEGR